MITVNLKDVQSQGFTCRGTIAALDVSDSQDDYIQFDRPIDVTVKLDRVDTTILAKTKVHGHFNCFCARCLKALSGTIDKEFLLDFEVEPAQETLEIGEDIRQEFIISLPIKITCKRDEQHHNKKEGIVLEEIFLEKDNECRSAVGVDLDDDAGDDGTYQPFANL